MLPIAFTFTLDDLTHPRYTKVSPKHPWDWTRTSMFFHDGPGGFVPIAMPFWLYTQVVFNNFLCSVGRPGRRTNWQVSTRIYCGELLGSFGLGCRPWQHCRIQTMTTRREGCLLRSKKSMKTPWAPKIFLCPRKFGSAGPDRIVTSAQSISWTCACWCHPLDAAWAEAAIRSLNIFAVCFVNALAGTPLQWWFTKYPRMSLCMWHVVAHSSEKFSETADFSPCGAWNRGYQQWVVQLLGPPVFGACSAGRTWRFSKTAVAAWRPDCSRQREPWADQEDSLDQQNPLTYWDLTKKHCKYFSSVSQADWIEGTVRTFCARFGCVWVRRHLHENFFIHGSFLAYHGSSGFVFRYGIRGSLNIWRLKDFGLSAKTIQSLRCLILYVVGHKMPKPCKAIGTPSIYLVHTHGTVVPQSPAN